MGLLIESLWVELLLAFLLVLYFLYWFLNNNNGYWDQREVANTKEGIFIKQMIGKQHQAELIKEWYEKFPDEKYFGYIQIKTPALVIRDLDLIHQILVKDFSHFQDRGQPENKNDPMSNNLFTKRGHMWREMRYKLTPTFTTGKLKGMFEQVSKCGANMIAKIEELSKKSSDVETKDFSFEFASDVIASCAFGVQFEPNTPEYDVYKKTVQQIFRFSLVGIIKVVFVMLFPEMSVKLNIRAFMGKESAEYFTNLIRETSKYRKDNNIKRNDYLQLLLTLKEQEEQGHLNLPGLTMTDTSEDDAVILEQMKYSGNDQPLAPDVKLFTEETVCANSVIFLVAGSESTSSTIGFTLYELARHPNVQQKLQQEVDAVLANHSGQWSYQTIRDMTYLDQVVQESQRFYPVVPLIQRECTKAYKIPDSDLVIEKGVIIGIPVSGLHKDPQFYPEPETFKPERFEANNFKPNPAYLPFGDGPRICIAMRFAVMEVKTALARIMADYTVKLSPKTEVPIRLDPQSFVPVVKGGLWLQFEKRQKT